MTGSLNGAVTRIFRLREVSSLYTTRLGDLIEKNITRPGGGDSWDVYS